MANLMFQFRSRQRAITNFNMSGHGYSEFKDSQMTETNRSNRGVITGIIVDQGANAQDTTAVIDGILWDDYDDARTTYTLMLHLEYNLRFKKIWAAGTTATKVILIGQ